MKIENKVPSLELCKKLLALGITKDLETERVWITRENTKTNWFDDWEIVYRKGMMKWINDGIPKGPYKGGLVTIDIPCPDLSELLELLPGVLNEKFDDRSRLNISSYANYWFVRYLFQSCGDPYLWCKADTAPNACAKMLIKLKEEEK